MSSVQSTGLSNVSTAAATTSTTAPDSQISGLASGLDTASIISAMMAVASLPEVAIKNQVQIQQAKQTAYQAVATELNSLTTAYQALTDVTTWAPTQNVTSSNASTVSATINGGAAAGAYEINVTQLARANQFTAAGASTAAADDVIHITNASGTTDVKISAGDSLSTIAQKITTTAGTPVYATVLNGTLVLSNQQTGTANAITSITTNGTSGLTFSQNQTAQDANFTIDANPYTSGSNIVSTAMAGVTLTLGGTTATPTTLVIGEPTPDTSTIESNLNAFVTQYNSVLSDLESRLSQQPVPNAQTPADFAQGALFNDQGLETLVQNLRDAFSDSTSGGGAYSTLAQVGVSTGVAVGSGSVSQDSLNGMLVVDSGTFENALSSNFSAVKALFTNATNAYGTEGVGQRLNTILTQYTEPGAAGGYLDNAIAGTTSSITALQTQVTAWDQRLAVMQQNYETEFTNMETALEGTQSVGAELTSQIATL